MKTSNFFTLVNCIASTLEILLNYEGLQRLHLY